VLLLLLNLKAMEILIKGIKEKDFVIDQNDSLSVKLSMLIEGHCTIGVHESIKKYGYTEQRYYQLLDKYHKEGAQGLIDKKTGSDKKPVRTKQIVNQIIRLRFLDPFASASVLAQKLTQMGHKVSIRSVERTITEFGLKKNACTEPGKRKETKRNRNTNI
jgi:transposase